MERPIIDSARNAMNAMNEYGRKGVPFLFIIDFLMQKPLVYPIAEIPPSVLFKTNLISTNAEPEINNRTYSVSKEFVSWERYLEAFSVVKDNILKGNTYLLNLTFPTIIKTDLSLKEIYFGSDSVYKLLYKDEFVVFSPETFVRIEKGRIISCPMKGTIDASEPDAEDRILNDEKEKSEHATIVDLIRNDLSIVSAGVSVSRYRYTEKIRAGGKELIQVSSEIAGMLDRGYESRLGDIIFSMLPAGSVTGAPKEKTVRIILDCEKYNRNWYTGVFGVYDGISLDSAVMIRYVEKSNNKLIYKSGGGITFLSDPLKEYEEMKAKVYVAAV